MGLRSRIMLLVTLGLLVATAPLGVMGLGMLRVATDRVLDERLAMTRVTAEHLNDRLAQGWWQLHQLSGRAAVTTDLRLLAPQLPLFNGGIFVTDASGRVLAQAPGSPALPSSVTSDPAVERTLRTGQQQASAFIPTARGGVVLFAVPVFDGSDRMKGVVAGVIDLASPVLLSSIRGLAVGSSGHAAIVAGDGTVLASTDSVEVFSRNEHPEFFARFIAEGRPIVGSTREDHGGGAEGRMHVMAFAPLTAVPWGLGIGQNEDETFGPIRRLRDRILVFEVLVLLAALTFAWLDTTAVVAPLRLLQRGAERIAEGDLAQPVDVRRGDEVGALSRSFETMRVRLLRSLEENARLQERLQSVAMVEERERLAREMHDSVGQVLGYVNTKAQAVRTLLDAGRVADAELQLGELEQAAREVYADLREAILSLRTAAGPGRRLVPALREYVGRFAEQTGVNASLVLEGDPARFEFSSTVEAHLIRIVQEALTNVRKHAAARSAVVRFAARDGTAVVTVEDDGAGFRDGGEHPASGFGLHTMRERAEAIGGRMVVSPRPAGGTIVEIIVPAAIEERDARLAG